MRKRAHPSNGIIVQQDKVDPFVTEDMSLDILSISPFLTPSAIQLQSSGWTNLVDILVMWDKQYKLVKHFVLFGLSFSVF